MLWWQSMRRCRIIFLKDLRRVREHQGRLMCLNRFRNWRSKFQMGWWRQLRIVKIKPFMKLVSIWLICIRESELGCWKDITLLLIYYRQRIMNGRALAISWLMSCPRLKSRRNRGSKNFHLDFNNRWLNYKN